MQSKATTVEQYLAELPSDRRAALEQVRAVIHKNLDKQGYTEGMQYGMISFFVPHSVYPAGYHCDPRQPLPFLALASQKNHMSLYMSTYLDDDLDAWLREAWAKSGKKLDMGKSCIRFKNVEELPLTVIGEAVRRVPAKDHIAGYEASLQATASGKGASKKTASKKVASKKVAAKAVSKKTASKKAAKRA